MGRSAEFFARAGACRVRARSADASLFEGWCLAASSWEYLARLEDDPPVSKVARPAAHAPWAQDPASQIRRLRLTAIAGGWLLDIAGVENPLLFMSGARAEAAARRIGASLAEAGASAEIEIYLRDGLLGARLRCIENPALTPGPTWPRREEMLA